MKGARSVSFVYSSIILILIGVALIALAPSFASGSGSFDTCATPVPGGTISRSIPYTLELPATKSMTFTTVYTLKNLEPRLTNIDQAYLRVPDCSLATYIHADELPSLAVKRYSLEDITDLPSDFSGEVYVSSALIITGTSKIISKITPTPTESKMFLPLTVR